MRIISKRHVLAGGVILFFCGMGVSVFSKRAIAVAKTKVIAGQKGNPGGNATYDYYINTDATGVVRGSQYEDFFVAVVVRQPDGTPICGAMQKILEPNP